VQWVDYLRIKIGLIILLYFKIIKEGQLIKAGLEDLKLI